MSLQEHRWSVDAIEGGVASVQVDDDRMMHVPRWMLPEDTREGAVLRVTHDRAGDRSVLTIVSDVAGTQLALERSLAQVRERIGEGDPGDIAL